MKLLHRLVVFAILCSISPAISYAETLAEVLNKAAVYFVKSAIQIPHGQPLYIMNIVNARSKRNDDIAKRIENELFLALERQKPDFKLFLVREAAAEEDVYLTGSYEPKGEKTRLYLRIVKGVENPRILAQFQDEYRSGRVRRRTLVAVLDLEADSLNTSARKAFSEIFRSTLSRQDVFDFVSNADIDKLDPESIQKTSGCTRDECATIIGEQLGVDRVISTSLLKIDENLYVLSGKLINIQNGAILKTRTVKHSGGISTLDESVEKLAIILVSDKEPEPTRVAEREQEKKADEKRDKRFDKERERLAKKRFKRDDEDKSGQPTSRDNRDDSIIFIGITPFGLHEPTSLTHPFVFGIYIGTGLQIGVESGTVNFENDSATATATNRAVFVRLFSGGSFNFRVSVNERIWYAETTDTQVAVTAQTTIRSMTIGIGNQWITDSGVTIGGDWVFFTRESETAVIYSKNFAQNLAAQAAFADLSKEEELFDTGMGLVNFTIGYSF